MNVLDRGTILCRIADTLGIPVGEVNLSHIGTSTSGSSLHCIGRANGKMFFAKLLLADEFPYLAPVLVPEASCSDYSDRMRSAKDQIRAEWVVASRLQQPNALVLMPRQLACSEINRTMIWQALSNSRPLAQIIKRAIGADRTGEIGISALWRVGAWLKDSQKAHEVEQTFLDLAHVRNILAQQRDVHVALRPFYQFALQIVTQGIEALGRERILLPTTLSHGDLSLPNILWCEDTNQPAIVDFEHTAIRTVVHDPVVLVSNLRAKLFNPLIPCEVVWKWEEAFWSGYNPQKELKIVIEVLASAWIYHWFLPRIADRTTKQPLLQWILRRFYEQLFERRLASTNMEMFLRRINMCSKAVGRN